MDDSHGICSVTGTDETFFMHGGKRAPTLINALPDGPSIGLTAGYTQIRPALVSIRTLTHVERERATLCLGIDDQFVNKNSDHNRSQCPD
jgi:hypothetical protein